jgi:MscS family membrane protein
MRLILPVRAILALIALVLAQPLLSPAAAWAQALAPAEETSAAPSVDLFGRTTPRGTVTGLLSALGDGDYARAGNYFQLAGRETPDEQGADLARRLQAVLDQGGTLAPFAALSNEPSGNIADGLAPEREVVGRFTAAGDEVAIALSRASDAEGAAVWRISPETIRSLRRDTAPVAAPVAQDGIASWSVAGAPLKDWLMLLGIAAGSFVGFQLLGLGVLWLARRLVRNRENEALGFLQVAMPPISLYLSVVAFYIWAGDLPVAIVARQTLLRYAGIVAWIAGAWLVLRLVDEASRIATARMERSSRRQAVSVITLLRRSAKVVLFAIAGVAILDTVGFDVTTGIAALGIGGIALALGAQKTIENLVGSVTVIADRPVQVGDFCKVGDVVGTVEDIGMRSTRIRTNERTVVTIPNGAFSSLQIENFSTRDRFLFNPTIGVEYGASPEALKRGVEAIEEVLKSHPLVDGEGARARFATFGESSLDIEIFSYITVGDFAESLVVRQELLLTIMARLETEGLGIAFPTRTLIVREEAPHTSSRPSSGDVRHKDSVPAPDDAPAR